ncbi:MAG: hypothetical protein ABIH25_05065 [Candidatus Woesearchaeota archaeon]
MKKGLMYIDWSISVAIFIVYLIGLFIYIAPALNQDYSEDYLKTLAKTGFQENTTNTLYKYPIFIKHHDAGIDYQFSMDAPSNINLNELKTAIYDEDLTQIEAQIEDNTPNPDKVTVHIPNIDAEVTKTIYMIISEEIYESIPYVGGEDPINEYEYAFGVPEVLTGLSQTKFNELKALSYEEIKEVLKYPAERNIAIDVYFYNELGEIIPENTLSIQPDIKTQNNTVYATQWSTWEINKNSNLLPITIRILTW